MSIKGFLTQEQLDDIAPGLRPLVISEREFSTLFRRGDGKFLMAERGDYLPTSPAPSFELVAGQALTDEQAEAVRRWMQNG